MKNPLLIIITGAPGTGKTNLGEGIAEKFRLPLITKDDIKETLLDSLGAKDREESKKFGIPSYSLLFHFLESLLRVGNSSVIEANFRPEYHSGKLVKLGEKYTFTPLQVFCSTDKEILLERYRKRGQSCSRHPGHFDDVAITDLEKDLLKGTYEPLDIGGGTIKIDTTDFNQVDYEDLFIRITSYLPSP